MKFGLNQSSRPASPPAPLRRGVPAHGPSAEQLRREIERGAERLLEISLALRDFLADRDGST